MKLSYLVDINTSAEARDTAGFVGVEHGTQAPITHYQIGWFEGIPVVSIPVCLFFECDK